MTVINVDDQTFEAKVLKSPRPVLVAFLASWCAPCQALAPTLDVVAEDWSGRVDFARLDVDQNRKTCGRYEISSYPTMVLFCDGEPVSAMQGAVPADHFPDFFAHCGVV